MHFKIDIRFSLIEKEESFLVNEPPWKRVFGREGSWETTEHSDNREESLPYLASEADTEYGGFLSFLFIPHRQLFSELKKATFMSELRSRLRYESSQTLQFSRALWCHWAWLGHVI